MKIPQGDWFIPMVVGGFFVLFGLVMIFWGRGEEKSYYDTFTTRTDVREYLEHWPEHPEPGALKLGGWVAIIVGVFILALGGFLFYR